MTNRRRTMRLAEAEGDQEYWLAEADITQEQRDQWAKDKVAMPDGSWPIPNKRFLDKAVISFGRGNKPQARVKAWIIKRAKALGAVKSLPAEWNVTEAIDPGESLDSVSEEVRDAWRAQFSSPIGQDVNSWVQEIYVDHVVAKIGDDYFSIPWDEDAEGDIHFDTTAAQKVERTWTAVESKDVGQFIKPLAEADGEPDGSEWDVCVIEAGVSANGVKYEPAVLKKAIPLFEGARVLLRSDEDHINGRGKSVANVVGWIDGVKMVGKQVRGTLHVSESAASLRSLLVDAWKRGKRDIAGLSIVAAATGRMEVVGGKRLKVPDEITKVSSVDVVYDPAAGGKLMDLVAAVGKEDSVERVLKLIEAALGMGDASVVKGLVAALSDDEKQELKEANAETWKKVDLALAEAEKDPEADDEKKKQKLAEAENHEEDEDDVPASLGRFVIKEALGDTKLPDPVKERIAKRFTGKAFKETELAEAISDELDTFAKLEKAGLVKSNGGDRDSGISVGIEDREKAKAALDGFFLGEAVEIEGQKIPRYQSFKQAYIALTGDKRISGELSPEPAGKLGLSEANGGTVKMKLQRWTEDADTGVYELTEAITVAAWNTILGDSVTRAMVREYNRSALNTWEVITDVVPVNDFRTQRRERFGGYGNLPAVTAGSAYGALTSPTNEEATYTPSKRGGTEVINLEAIANDDIGAIRRVPVRLARAAAQTLHEFVYDMLRTNAAIYDSVALFHATHANLGATALGTASLSAALQRMRKQTEKDSSKKLGLIGRHLLVPIDLEETAFVLTASDRKQGTADNDANFVQSKNIDYTVIDYLSDTNDWFLAADKGDTPILEVGFYGPQDPELFTQDMPNVGSMFTNDQLTYKIRHVYGGAVVDYRGLDGSVV